MLNLPFHLSEIVFAAPLIWGGLRGYNRGTMLQFISLMSLLLLFFVFTFFIYALSKTFFDWFGWDIVSIEVFFTVIIIIAVIFGVHVFVRFLFENYSGSTAITPYSRLLGLVLGILRYAFMLSMLYNLLAQISSDKNQDSWFFEARNSSYIYKYNKLIAPFIFTYLRFDETRELEEIKASTLNFGGQKIPIETTLEFMCDSTKNVVWRYMYLNPQETISPDSTLIEAKLSYKLSSNLNTFTYQFLHLKNDSTIILYRYFENNQKTQLNRAYLNLSNAYIEYLEQNKTD